MTGAGRPANASRPLTVHYGSLMIVRPRLEAPASFPARAMPSYRSDLPARPLRRPGRHRHRRRLRDRPLHRARAGRARRRVAIVGRNVDKLDARARRDRSRRRGMLDAMSATSARKTRCARPSRAVLERPRPHRRPRQQRRRPVPVAARADQREGLGRGRAQQPDRRLPGRARMRDAVDGATTAAPIVNIIADMWHGMPGMGHSGAARAGMLNFTETAALEWAPVRDQRRRARLDRVERHGQLPAADARAHPRDAQARAAAAPRHRERSLGRDRLPAVAGRGVHLRRLPARSTARRRTPSASGPRSAPAAAPSRSTASTSRARPKVLQGG